MKYRSWIRFIQTNNKCVNSQSLPIIFSNSFLLTALLLYIIPRASFWNLSFHSLENSFSAQLQLLPYFSNQEFNWISDAVLMCLMGTPNSVPPTTASVKQAKNYNTYLLNLDWISIKFQFYWIGFAQFKPRCSRVNSVCVCDRHDIYYKQMI